MEIKVEVEFLKIKYKDIITIWDIDEFEFNLHKLPVFIQSSILEYKDPMIKQLKIEGKLLLINLIHEFNLEEKYNLNNIKTSNTNKPYLNDEIDFSISHSGNVVICGLSIHNRIGLDLEKIIPNNLNLFDEYLTKKEIYMINKNQNPNQYFYNIWTRKEALSKVTGFGIELKFNTVDVTNDNIIFQGKNYKFTQLEINNKFICSLIIEES